MLQIECICFTIGLYLLLVDSHIIFPAFESLLEEEKTQVNSHIGNISENGHHVKNSNIHHNETSEDSEKVEEIPSSEAVTHHDEFTVIYSEHHKKEPTKLKEFPLSISQQEEPTTITAKIGHLQATNETASTIFESEKAIETKTMKTERESNIHEHIENDSTTKDSEQTIPTKVHQTETYPAFASTTNKITTTTSKPKPSKATSLKINFLIFLMTIFACLL